MITSAQRLEAGAWAQDHRNCQRDTAPVLYLDDGTEMQMPTRWVVCPVCDGAGTHVNPAIDCGGLSAEDFADDPDFAEDYFSGAYDQPCNRCAGRTTVREVDLDRLSAEHRSAYEQQTRDEAYYQAMCRAEQMAGA